MTQKHDAKTVVLRKVVDEEEASSIIEDKKTSLFKSLLKKPKKEDVHVDSIKLNKDIVSSPCFIITHMLIFYLIR